MCRGQLFEVIVRLLIIIIVIIIIIIIIAVVIIIIIIIIIIIYITLFSLDFQITIAKQCKANWCQLFINSESQNSFLNKLLKYISYW